MMLKRRLINWLLSHLLVAPDLNKIITTNEAVNRLPNKVWVGGKELNNQQIRNLQEEARFIAKTDLWQIMNHTLADHAQKTMFEKSTSWESMQAGKLILFATDLQKQILKSVTSVKLVD